MKLLSRDNPARPVLLVCFSYIVIGYVLFFAARALPTPVWGPDFMAWWAPVIKAIHTATRVGLLKDHDPFPIQLVILYCVLGMPLLVLYSAKIEYFNKRARERLLNNMVTGIRKHNYSRVKLFFIGLFILILFTFFPYLGFFTGRSSNSISWRTIGMYSPTVFATFLFLGLSLMSLFINIAIAQIYLAFSRRLNSPPNVIGTEE